MQHHHIHKLLLTLLLFSSTQLEKVAAEYEGKVKIMKIDTDIESDLASTLQVYAMPTLLFIKDGKIQQVGIIKSVSCNFRLHDLAHMENFILHVTYEFHAVTYYISHITYHI